MDVRTSVGAATVSRSVIDPFPWNALERIPRVQAAALRDVRRWMAATVPLEAWASAALELLGMRISARLDGGAGAPLGVEGALAVVLGRAGGFASPDPHDVTIEVEPGLAAAVLARTLGRRTPRAVGPSLMAPQSIAGAFAAVVVATVRRGGHGDALIVRSAGLATEVVGPSVDATEAGARRIAASMTVLLDGEAYAARLVISSAMLTATRAPWSAHALALLGPMPLAIPIVACVAACARSEFGALAPGDIFLPSSWPLSPVSAGTLRGPVTLAAPDAGTGVRAVFGDDGRLVLSGKIEPLSAAEADMSDAEDTAAILSAVGDVPVVVRVEIGEARMAARDWASIRIGDVVTLGQRVGEQVVLRVGGVPVARGQLVDVDGEVGVKIEERVVEERTTA